MSISGTHALQVLREAATVEFKKAVRDQDWTTAVLRALASLAPKGACIDPDVSAPRRGTGRAAREFLWDLTISSWPNYKDTPYEYPGYFDQAAKHPARLLLVAESEWGAAKGRKKNASAVMDDFVKLLGARAPLKVMVFSYFSSGASTFEELSGLMVRLIRAAGDDADYVLFGVAWGEGEECRDLHVENNRAGKLGRGS